MIKYISGGFSLIFGIMFIKDSYSYRNPPILTLVLFLLALVILVTSFIIEDAIREHERKFHNSHIPLRSDLEIDYNGVLLNFYISKKGLSITEKNTKKDSFIREANLVMKIIKDKDKSEYLLIEDFVNKNVNYKLKYNSEELTEFYKKYLFIKGY